MSTDFQFWIIQILLRQMFHNSKSNFTDFKILRNTSTGKGNLSFCAFFHKVAKIKNPEKGTALRNQRKFDVYKKNGHL